MTLNTGWALDIDWGSVADTSVMLRVVRIPRRVKRYLDDLRPYRRDALVVRWFRRHRVIWLLSGRELRRVGVVLEIANA